MMNDLTCGNKEEILKAAMDLADALYNDGVYLDHVWNFGQGARFNAYIVYKGGQKKIGNVKIEPKTIKSGTGYWRKETIVPGEVVYGFEFNNYEWKKPSKDNQRPRHFSKHDSIVSFLQEEGKNAARYLSHADAAMDFNSQFAKNAETAVAYIRSQIIKGLGWFPGSSKKEPIVSVSINKYSLLEVKIGTVNEFSSEGFIYNHAILTVGSFGSENAGVIMDENYTHFSIKEMTVTMNAVSEMTETLMACYKAAKEMVAEKKD